MADILLKELIKISEEKILRLYRIVDVTKKQEQAIETDKLADLQKYIDKKQNEIDCINELDNDFSNKYTELKEKFNIESLEDIPACHNEDIKILQTKIGKISDILKLISDQEVINNDKINRNFKEVKAKLKQVKNGKKATQGYTKHKDMSQSILINKTK